MYVFCFTGPGNDEAPPPKRSKHPGRKKTRRSHLWKRNVAKKERNEGNAYIDRKGRQHEEKQVRPYVHQCRYKCNESFSEEQRQEIFKEYWKLGDWNLQTSYLNSCLTIQQPLKQKDEANYSKSITCLYTFLGKRVCKQFFLNTLDISNKRITNVINKKKDSQTDISPRDKRGHRPPGNKLCQDKIERAKEHIRSFPKYSSHYSRTYAPNRKYLCGNLNISKMYSLYTEFCKEKDFEPVKLIYYRYLFNTQFNLCFHKPQTDTCATCDRLQNMITNGQPLERDQALTEKELHLRRAESARQQLKDAEKEVKADDTHIAICFDLQKMLPSPVLTCSKVYYSRQLWTYNFCVHDLGSGNANMYMWHEGQAARGCEEMLSCLLKFINTLPANVKKITMFSDNAGGQNKSRFTVKFWLFVVENTRIEQVDHKYLLSGHSYNDCDRNFGVIERCRRQSSRGIYVPQDWMDVVARSSKRFVVASMRDEEFISLQALEDHYVKVVKGIRGMQWLRFCKSDPHTLFYKTTFNPDMPFSSYSMKPKPLPGRPRSVVAELPSKNNHPGIKSSKFKDLQELLQFVPPCHHPFYNNLRQTGQRQGRRMEGPDEVLVEEEDHILDTDEDDV